MTEPRWTHQQVQAIVSADDTLLAASAGTGKTTTVVGKIMWRLGLPFGLDGETGEPLAPHPNPCKLSEVAAITFTEKAAYDLKRQLRRRIRRSPAAEELKWELNRASVGTMHSFCGEILREHALRFGVDPMFEVLDEEEASAEQDQVIKGVLMSRLEAGDEAARAILRRMNLTGRGFQGGAVDHVRTVMRDLRWRGARYGWLRRPPGGPPVPDHEQLRDVCAWDELDEPPAELCRHLIDVADEARARWDRWQGEENKRDFDSLVLDAADILLGKTGASALSAIRRRYRLLIIDEFQDTDSAQRDIALAIAGRSDGTAQDGRRPQLFLVGDPKQSIYRFRGADITVWNEVAGHVDNVIDLPRNFRSAPPIVGYVNELGRTCIGQTAEALAEERPGGSIAYSDLEVGVDPHERAGVEWVPVPKKGRYPDREGEAKAVAEGILAAVKGTSDSAPANGGSAAVRGSETGALRPPEFGDFAVLYRTRAGLAALEKALRRHGIPAVVAGTQHLDERQEIRDVLNALRVIRNERDDLRAFGFLRSPFVGLRDETIARIRLLGRPGPLLRQARRWLEQQGIGTQPAEGDSPGVAEIEKDALRKGLAALANLRRLAPRLPLDELIEELLRKTGYRLHLLLMDGAEEPLANLQSLIQFAEGRRAEDLSAFFEIWDRSVAREIQLPQVPLHSSDDDVVTLTTIHQAKGLEWPVVYLVGVNGDVGKARANEYWADPHLGPVFNPKEEERGVRARRLVAREEAEILAEEARLLYVATTRARDRLFLVGDANPKRSAGYDRWLLKTGEIHKQGREGGPGARSGSSAGSAPLHLPRPPSLEWLAAFTVRPPSRLVKPIPPPGRWAASATELMLKERDAEAWEHTYLRGVEASREFAPDGSDGSGDQVSGRVRGLIIHGALERIERDNEIAAVLEETIGSLDEPGLEEALRPEGDYRLELEKEILKVVQSPEWAWYTEGRPGADYWKELRFVHLVGPRRWRTGAFDLFRLVSRPVTTSPSANPWAEADLKTVVIDFKTHAIVAEQAGTTARDYVIQAKIYREASEALAGPTAVGLHFTNPGVLVPMDKTLDSA